MTNAEQITTYNARTKRLTGVHFNVIETATGRVVGSGAPLPYDYAKYVRDVRDCMNSGAFLVKRCN